MTPPGRRSGSGLYLGLRAATMDPALAAEFGVADAEQLVDALNAIYASRGESPLPQGSYPTTRERMQRLAALYRAERPSVGGPKL